MSLGPASEFFKDIRASCRVGEGGRSLRVTLREEISVEYSGIETVMLKTSVLSRRCAQ